DRRTARAAQVRAVVAAINLKLLDVILADGETNATRITIRLTSVNRDAVAAAVTAIKREAALRRLFDAKILVVGQPRGIRHARHQHRKCKVVAAVDRQIRDIVLCESIRLASSLGLNDGRLRTYFHLG